MYAYYGGVDKIAHERGFGEYYEAELRAADRIVGDVIEQLPPGAVLLVTADHGQVHVGTEHRPPVQGTARATSRCSRARGGSGGCTPGEGVLRISCGGEGCMLELAWVVTRDQMLDEHWFGPTIAPPIASRLGDVAIVAHQPVSYWEPADSGPFELVCRHGSLTSAEVHVPLVAALGS